MASRSGAAKRVMMGVEPFVRALLTRGKGTRFNPSFRKSLNEETLQQRGDTRKRWGSHPFNCPGNRRLVLTPHIT